MGFGILLAASGIGCTTEPEASASEKKYNPKDAEQAVQGKYAPQTSGSPNVVVSNNVLYPNDIFHPTEIHTETSDYTVRYDTPGLASKDQKCEIKSITVRKSYEYSRTSSWNYYQDQAPLSPEQQQGGSNADYDGSLLGLELFTAPAQAGWEQAVSTNGPWSTWTFSTDFNYNGTFCSATQTRKSFNAEPSMNDWRVRRGEMSCTSMPAATEAGLSGERQVAECLGNALTGN